MVVGDVTGFPFHPCRLAGGIPEKMEILMEQPGAGYAQNSSPGIALIPA